MTNTQLKYLGELADRAETGLLPDEDIQFLRALCADAQSGRRELTHAINKCNLRISEINAEIANARSRNVYLKPDVYQALMAEKRDLRQKVVDIEASL